MKPELLVLIGLPASGKSTIAREWMAEDPDARITISYDSLRVGMFGEGWIWNRKEENQMQANAQRIIVDALRVGLSVVIDNTNLSKHVRARWAELAQQHGAEYAEQDMPTTLEECIHRDRQRTGKARVGQAVIDQMAMEYGLLDWDECTCWADAHDPSRENCLRNLQKPIAIVDIDGTVADCGARLKHIKPDESNLSCGAHLWVNGRCPNCQMKKPHKDWPAFFAEVANDAPITNMINLLSKLATDHLIVMVSGRPVSSGRTKVGILTEDWLRKHGIQFDRLFLRRWEGDGDKDFEYKKSILDMIPKDRVKYVFEDRDQCVKMYREELKGSDALVMQVKDGSY